MNVSEVVLGDVPPDGDPDLRGVIAALSDVDPEWVVVTSGASEAIAILLCISAQPDHNVHIPNPAFTPFEVMRRHGVCKPVDTSCRGTTAIGRTPIKSLRLRTTRPF
ncbi:hypothetical protein AS026_01380 [Rhizobium altiplani]|uniref:Aminotransferase class I/classII large domain-containing protein n=1 Tax=Rhizobium altiplani TaxID=1864509 RepID=A0A109J9I3_9HYPH|nr:hypothetical protein AS026_01380 [Rhizobium altiplani]